MPPPQLQGCPVQWSPTNVSSFPGSSHQQIPLKHSANYPAMTLATMFPSLYVVFILFPGEDLTHSDQTAFLETKIDSKLFLVPPSVDNAQTIPIPQGFRNYLEYKLFHITKLQSEGYKNIFKASALWADAFHKSKCPSVCLWSVCTSVHF